MPTAAGRLPLFGVPVALKDNICTRGVRDDRAGRGSSRTIVPPYDATVVERLEAAGAVIVGKTNCDEFAMGSSTENSAFGPTRNPWALDRTPGGSSGGSAAAVAARLVPLSLGSDTGGSIRQPAALCGVVGLKPTYGRVSRYGLIAFASSLDQIGPFATSVADAALAMSMHRRPRPARLDRVGRGRARLSRARLPNRTGACAACASACRGACSATASTRTSWRRSTPRSTLARGRGAELVDVELPHSAQAIAGLLPRRHRRGELQSGALRRRALRLSARPRREASARCTSAPAKRASAAEVKRRIILGTYVLSAGYYDAYYLKAQQVRTLHPPRLRRRRSTASTSIAMPTSPTPAFKLGERTEDPLQMYLSDVFTVSANLAGLPAISVPCGFAAGRLPIGLQLTGRPMEDAQVLRAADAYARATSWSSECPAPTPVSPPR